MAYVAAVTAETTPSGRPIRLASAISARPASRRSAPGRTVWSSRPHRWVRPGPARASPIAASTRPTSAPGRSPGVPPVPDGLVRASTASPMASTAMPQGSPDGAASGVTGATVVGVAPASPPAPDASAVPTAAPAAPAGAPAVPTVPAGAPAAATVAVAVPPAACSAPGGRRVRPADARCLPKRAYAPKVSFSAVRAYAPNRPKPRAPGPVAGGRASRGRRAVATDADAVSGTSASRVRVAGTGRGCPAARKSVPSPSKGRPVRWPRRCRKTSSATVAPRGQAGAVVVADPSISRAGPRPTADRPGRGRVAGSVRATAIARYTVAASGAAHQARRSAEAGGSAVPPRAWP